MEEFDFSVSRRAYRLDPALKGEEDVNDSERERRTTDPAQPERYADLQRWE